MALTKLYVNLRTHEITTDRRKAMQWYRDGYSIEIYRDGKRILTMNF